MRPFEISWFKKFSILYICVNKLVLGLKMSSKQTGLCCPSEFNRLVHIVVPLVLRYIYILKDLMHLFLEHYWRERFSIVELEFIL